MARKLHEQWITGIVLPAADRFVCREIDLPPEVLVMKLVGVRTAGTGGGSVYLQLTNTPITSVSEIAATITKACYTTTPAAQLTTGLYSDYGYPFCDVTGTPAVRVRKAYIVLWRASTAAAAFTYSVALGYEPLQGR
jgi:hypothetical protein